MEPQALMIVSTPKELRARERERRRVRPAVGRAAARLAAAPRRPTPTTRASSTTSRRARPALLAELARQSGLTSRAAGHAAAVPQEPREAATYLLSTTTLLLVRGKALNLAVYAAYESPADVEWVRTVTARWIEDLKRLNR